MRVVEVKAEAEIDNLDKMQQRWLNLCKVTKRDRESLVLSIIESDIGIRESAKA